MNNEKEKVENIILNDLDDNAMELWDYKGNNPMYFYLDNDYKIIKCSEASLVGEEMPYDITALHAERQALRDKINELEDYMKTNNG